jgi:precorrin-6A/cobalt-precorrin-6A reductase
MGRKARYVTKADENAWSRCGTERAKEPDDGREAERGASASPGDPGGGRVTVRLLLLAGTLEGRQIANALAQERRVRMTVSIARSERPPTAFDVPVRIGGFGGDAGFAAFMEDQGVDAVLDATHPFAAAISHRTAAYCSARGIPYIQFLRPSWLPGPRDRWAFLNSEIEVAERLPGEANVFIATGRDTMRHYGGLTSQYVVCRVLSAPLEPFPLPRGRWLYSPPPFDVASELRLLRELATDWLVVRNSGGSSSRAKVDAARELGIGVAMIRRPPQPLAPRVSTVAEALAWVRRRL